MLDTETSRWLPPAAKMVVRLRRTRHRCAVIANGEIVAGTPVDKDLLSLVLEKAYSPAFRELMISLVKRCDEYEKISARNLRASKELRAKRERITVEQIDAQTKKALAKFSVTPKELEDLQLLTKQVVDSANNDAELLELVLQSEKDERDWQLQNRGAKKMPAENQAMAHEQFKFLDEHFQMLLDFAKSNDWPLPSRLTE